MSERLHRAVDLAARAHSKQLRKDQKFAIPYVAHVYGVAMLLARDGFPEDVVIAGLLHDVFEDAPQFRADVEAFGENVTRWVQTVTDPGKHDPAGERDWERRKEGYISQIRAGEPEAKAIACADKIHNMESLLMALAEGDRPPFKRPLDAQVRYWERVREAFGDWRSPMLREYDALLEELKRKSKT